MSKIKALATDIVWDTDGEMVSLPKSVSLQFDSDEVEDIGIEDYVSDLLSDLYGYCHKGFKLQVS